MPVHPESTRNNWFLCSSASSVTSFMLVLKTITAAWIHGGNSDRHSMNFADGRLFWPSMRANQRPSANHDKGEPGQSVPLHRHPARKLGKDKW